MKQTCCRVLITKVLATLLFLALVRPVLSGPANEERSDRTLIVLAAPRAADPYYQTTRKDILEFLAAYAQSVLGRDNVIVLGDRKTLRELSRQLPQDILLEAPMRDIWIRDFTPVRPSRPVLFRYSAAAQGGNQAEAEGVQKVFRRFARRLGLAFQEAPWILDGGNVVDNGEDKAVVTDRFLADNHLDKPEAVALLREQLGVEQVAIIPADPEDPLAHADGMVLFPAADTLAINRYNGPFRESLLAALREAFPDIRIFELETSFQDNGVDDRFGSAMGIYVNAVVTEHCIYLPVYGMATDAKAVEQVRAHTDREVVLVEAGKIARLGGSVRCLSWQVKGENARKLMEAARKHNRRGSRHERTEN